MLKFITLAVCVIGFLFLGPKALAEFRQAGPRTRKSPTSKGGTKETGDEPRPGVAA